MMPEESLSSLILHTLSESAQALGPLVAVLAAVFLIFFRDIGKGLLRRMVLGVALAALGLLVFLMGVRIGFIPYARSMGLILATDHSTVVLVIVGFALGLTATMASRLSVSFLGRPTV